MKHTHVSTLTAVTIACYVIIIGFLLRSLSVRLAGSDSPWGKALAYIY